jgi:hypothetical protein
VDFRLVAFLLVTFRFAAFFFAAFLRFFAAISTSERVVNE